MRATRAGGLSVDEFAEPLSCAIAAMGAAASRIKARKPRNRAGSKGRDLSLPGTPVWEMELTARGRSSDFFCDVLISDTSFWFGICDLYPKRLANLILPGRLRPRRKCCAAL